MVPGLHARVGHAAPEALDAVLAARERRRAVVGPLELVGGPYGDLAQEQKANVVGAAGPAVVC